MHISLVLIKEENIWTKTIIDSLTPIKLNQIIEYDILTYTRNLERNIPLIGLAISQCLLN